MRGMLPMDLAPVAAGVPPPGTPGLHTRLQPGKRMGSIFNPARDLTV